MQADGTLGAIMTLASTYAATTAVAKLDIYATESSGSTSGNAEVMVYSSKQNMLAQFRTSGPAGAAHTEIWSEGTAGAVLTVRTTNTATSSNARLDVLADPAGGATSGDASLYVYSMSQDVHAEVKTSGAAGVATMQLHSEGTQGAISTVISTNVATTAEARLDVLADPGAGTGTSGDAVANIYSRSQEIKHFVTSD